ncbi:hypothetical protein [Cupriavidus campinensis]
MVVSTLWPASHASRKRYRWGLPSILFFYTVLDIPQAALVQPGRVGRQKGLPAGFPLKIGQKSGAAPHAAYLYTID